MRLNRCWEASPDAVSPLPAHEGGCCFLKALWFLSSAHLAPSCSLSLSSLPTVSRSCLQRQHRSLGATLPNLRSAFAGWKIRYLSTELGFITENVSRSAPRCVACLRGVAGMSAVSRRRCNPTVCTSSLRLAARIKQRSEVSLSKLRTVCTHSQPLHTWI